MAFELLTGRPSRGAGYDDQNANNDAYDGCSTATKEGPDWRKAGHLGQKFECSGKVS